MSGAPLPRSLERLIEALSRLPGVGPRTAERLAFHILRTPLADAQALAAAISAAREQTRPCEVCGHVADEVRCRICMDDSRDTSTLCVVEEPLDLIAIERTGAFRGRYHVLNGALSPMAGVGPGELRMRELFERVAAFASFGFAKSHAAAFARTAFESAWLRLHYPAHYLAGLIRAQPMGFYPVEALIHDARRHGVIVQPVCINRSEARTSTESLDVRGAISSDPFIVVPTPAERAAAGSERALSYAVRLGLNLVRGVGTRTAERIVAERTRGGDFRSLDDLARRTQLPLSALERLIRAGALDAFGAERRALLWQAAEVGAEITLPPSDAPAHLTPVDRLEALIDAHGLVGADPTMQPIELWRDALTRAHRRPPLEQAAAAHRTRHRLPGARR